MTLSGSLKAGSQSLHVLHKQTHQIQEAELSQAQLKWFECEVAWISPIS